MDGEELECHTESSSRVKSVVGRRIRQSRAGPVANGIHASGSPTGRRSFEFRTVILTFHQKYTVAVLGIAGCEAYR
jgi:hypothetical protein